VKPVITESVYVVVGVTTAVVLPAINVER